MKKSVRAFVAKKRAQAVALGVTASAMTASAHAELPQEALDAIEALKTDGLALVNSGWGIAAAVVIGLALIGIFKKTVSRAT